MSNIVEVYRKATDVSSKIQAAFAGGVTTGGVTSIIAAINPDWDAPTWLVGLITLFGALLFGYLKKEKVNIATVKADGTVIQNGTVDLTDLPELEMPDWVAAQLDAQETVGADESEQTAGPDDEPKHAA
jgi:hypothetical protein